MTLSAEDAKLVTLARATRARTRAEQGASVRDRDGRTYAAATVALDSLQVSAVGVAVAMAISSGATGLEAVAIVSESEVVAETDLAIIAEFSGSEVVVIRADLAGTVRD